MLWFHDDRQVHIQGFMDYELVTRQCNSPDYPTYSIAFDWVVYEGTRQTCVPECLCIQNIVYYHCEVTLLY